jgi:hypothetical protein
VKVFVVLLLLVLFLVTPSVALCGVVDVPFCDVALWSGKFLDWLVCQVFAMIVGNYVGDNFGNGVVWD